MEMMLDQSVRKIWELKSKTKLNILQLRTPLTQYARDNLNHIKYGLDNGSYSEFNANTFERMALKAKYDDLCLWVAMPDVVGDHYSTALLYEHWCIRLGFDGESGKRAFVIQDGCNLLHPDNEPPWDILEAVFVGGTDYYKESEQCYEVVKKAKKLNKMVHVGRVNTPSRITYWYDVADSFDGSGIAKYDHMKKRAIDVLYLLENTKQKRLGDYI